MTARKLWIIRLTISLVFGLIVMGVALTSVGGTRSRDVRFEQKTTRLRLERVNAALAKYRGQNNEYPQTLSALKLDQTTEKDGWDRDWIYSTVNGSPLVESLGRDGKRGDYHAVAYAVWPLNYETFSQTNFDSLSALALLRSGSGVVAASLLCSGGVRLFRFQRRAEQDAIAAEVRGKNCGS